MNANYNRQDILQGLFNILQNMLEHANNNEWEAVADCNKLRLKLAEQLQPTKNRNNPDEKQIINELYNMDVEIIAMAEKVRDTAAGDMERVNGRKSKVSQYLQNQYS